MLAMRPILARAALAGAVLALAACQSSTESDAELGDAVVAADLAAAEGGAIALDLADLPAPGTAVTGTTTTGTTTVTRTVTFLDASGATMGAYDASLTASVRHALQVNGTRSGTGPQGTFTSAIHRSHTRTLSGLAGAETQHTWNGAGTAADTTTHTGARNTRVYRKTVLDTATNVVLALPRVSNPYPLSGEMVHRVNATVTVSGARSESRTVERRVAVTFNGTAAVPITVGSVSCTLHLDTRNVDGCSR